ncbi:MAG: hypothetical protein JWP91_4202, partial [Fibrobacteres bacterium]|nr:hypothetical protein [Fibrobacterota bacterium]
MQRRAKAIGIAFTLCSAIHAAVPGIHSTLPGTLLQSIGLPGVRGRIDHMAIDTLGRKLFVAALGNNSLEVVDLDQGRVAHSIHGLPEPQGVVFLPIKNRIYVANGDDGTVREFDAKTYAPLQVWKLGSDADNLQPDPTGTRIYAGFGEGGITALNPDSNQAAFKVALPGHPEAFQPEAVGKRIFVNIPEAGEIAVLDREKKAVISHWPLG